MGGSGAQRGDHFQESSLEGRVLAGFHNLNSHQSLADAALPSVKNGETAVRFVRTGHRKIDLLGEVKGPGPPIPLAGDKTCALEQLFFDMISPFTRADVIPNIAEAQLER